jgi:hypothetical protein
MRCGIMETEITECPKCGEKEIITITHNEAVLRKEIHTCHNPYCDYIKIIDDGDVVFDNS